MGRVIWMSSQGFVRLFTNVRLLVAAREVGSMEENLPRVPEKPETMDVREVRMETLDAVAGSEFVDDRIRLRG